MSLFKQILSPFIEFKEETPAEAADRPVPVAAPAEASPYNPAATPLPAPKARAATVVPAVASGASGAAVKPEHQAYFEHLLEEANAKNPLFQGTDFKEFIDSKIDVAAITDESTKYRTAFNVLKRTGLTKERLVTTGEEYLRLIERDLQGFDQAFAQQYQANVEQKERLLQQKAEELQILNDKITALNEQMKQISQEITQSKNQLTANRASFLTAGENKLREIQTELQKIDHYFS